MTYVIYPLWIYPNETSQDKLLEAYNRQSIIAIQVHDKLHEYMFVSTCSFHLNDNF